MVFQGVKCKSEVTCNQWASLPAYDMKIEAAPMSDALVTSSWVFSPSCLDKVTRVKGIVAWIHKHCWAERVTVWVYADGVTNAQMGCYWWFYGCPIIGFIDVQRMIVYMTERMFFIDAPQLILLMPEEWLCTYWKNGSTDAQQMGLLLPKEWLCTWLKGWFYWCPTDGFIDAQKMVMYMTKRMILLMPNNWFYWCPKDGYVHD